MISLSSPQKALLLVIGGLIAGFLNGLIGAGGGILLVFLLGAILPSTESTRPGKAADKRDIFANALASMLPVTAISVISYATRGDIHLEEAEVYVFPAIIGGLLGAWLLDKIRFSTARRLFSFIVIASGIAMLLK